MHPDTWQRLGNVFSQVIALPAPDRAAWLDRECEGDPTLRAEVEAMVAAHETGGDDENPHHLLPSLRPTIEPIRVGSELGPYRLTAVVGRGGMGEVYRAVRADDQFEHQVAIKVVRPERSTPELTRRFLQERQIMASLDHPSIAALLDGGIGPGGQPYLVMQYVDGVPITEYCTHRQMPVTERLDLFVKVCQAVQYAHGHLVVHRDLKPSNILVDSLGAPRLLDFGIAKLLDPAAAASTTGDLLLLTPEHAAPEQFLGQPVTTATDVYALGVLLYELLTGSRPFRDVPAAELPRAVCEAAPRSPSALRPVDADLEQIVLMALRKEPSRRYASAGQLGEDVSRFLGGWPVIARADTAGYRVRRFVARNRIGVAAAVAIAVALAGATGWSAWQSARRAAALEMALAQQGRADRMANFLLGVFRATNPNETRGRTVTARELLDQASARVKRDLAQDPVARTDMELAIGQAYLFVGLTATAESLFTTIVEDRRAMTPSRPLEVAAAQDWLARSKLTGGKLRDGVGVMKDVLATREQLLGPNALELVPALQRIGFATATLEPDSEEPMALLNRALGILRAADSGQTRQAAELLRYLGIQAQNNKPAEALRLHREAVAIAERHAQGEDDPSLFNFHETLAITMRGNGMLDSSIAMHQKVLAGRRRVFGAAHIDLTFSLFNLARDLRAADRLREAFPLFQECVAMREQLFGPDHYQVAYAVGAYARAVADSGDLAGASKLFRRAASIAERAFGPEHEDAIGFYEEVAMVEVLAGRRDAALAALTTIVDRGYQGLDKAEFASLASDRRFLSLKTRVRPGSE